MPLDPLLARLSRYVQLDSGELGALKSLRYTSRKVARGEPVAQLGERLPQLFIVSAGVVCRCKMIGRDDRQTLAFHLPGDGCNLDIPRDRPLDFGLVALSAAELLLVDRRELDRVRAVGRIGVALDRMVETDAVVSRTWLANISGRRASARLAHLLCELDLRTSKSKSKDAQFPFGLTQEDFAQAIGVSTIQLNRTMSELRDAGFLLKRGRELFFRDHLALARHGDFDPGYLN